MTLTIQKILASSVDQLRAGYRLAKHHQVAISRLLACRTGAMGQHVRCCAQGHVHSVHYNSCRHRSCPQCGWLQSQRWLAREEQRLLDCDHFHVIFTIPQELHPLWRYNYHTLANVLFRATTESLLELLADRKYLGARPGILAVLHTWTKQLTLHPHIHALVTGGGLTGHGQWRAIRGERLLPFRVLMHKFRGKLRALLLAELEAGQWTIPPSTTAAQLRGLFNRIGRMTLNVKILERYQHGRGVAVYLARYLRGGPISHRRLLSHRQGTVAFRYLDRRDTVKPVTRVARLRQDHFLLRYLQHVPPKGFVAVRRYGLYANASVARYRQARARCGMLSCQGKEPPGIAELLLHLGVEFTTQCPVCQLPLEWRRIPPSQQTRAPP